MKLFKCFLTTAVLFAFCGGAFAETVMVEEFNLENDEVDVPCPVEEIITKRLVEIGCDPVSSGVRATPDIIITGSFRVTPAGTEVTVSAADMVNSQLILKREMILPTDEEACAKAVLGVTEAIGDPPFYARKQNFFDSATGLEFVFVPGGTYRMGLGVEKGPWATVSNFLMARTEVTQELWTRIMGRNPSYFYQYPDLPVENVSWYDAMEFIRILNERTGTRYRLPTEAEWEYAARTRGRTFMWAGTGVEQNLSHFAWWSDNSAGHTQPVAKKRANGLGLYDMSGNVWEWCSDRYPIPEKEAAQTGSSERMVIRGGSWMMGKKDAQTFNRAFASPESRFQDNGLRLVIDVSQPKVAGSQDKTVNKN